MVGEICDGGGVCRPARLTEIPLLMAGDDLFVAIAGIVLLFALMTAAYGIYRLARQVFR